METEEQKPRSAMRSYFLAERLPRWSGIFLLLAVVLFVALRAISGEPEARSGPPQADEQLRPDFPKSTSTEVAGPERGDPAISEFAHDKLQEEAPPAVEGGVAGRPKTEATTSPMVEPSCAIITDDRVRLRESPAGAIRAVVNTGLPVLLLLDRADVEGYRWAKIRLDSVERWVAENYVQTMPCS